MKLRLFTKLIYSIVITAGLATTYQLSAKEISQKKLQQLMQNDEQVIVLDVRSQKEFEEGHIPGAMNIPHSELGIRLMELSNAKTDHIVLYCRSGKRAEVARQIMVKSGFNQLDHLAGDFNEWTSKNLPVISTK